MKHFFLIISILLFTFSCSKTVEEMVITETDNQGNIIVGDTNQGKFSILKCDTNNPNDKIFYYENTIGFMPFKQNCNDSIKLSMYPNPMTGNDILRYKIASNKNIIDIRFWPLDGSSMFGDKPRIPTKFIDAEYGGFFVNGQRTDNKTMKYQFMVVTEDSCVYTATWQVIKK